jgi:hypothetical protein
MPETRTIKNAFEPRAQASGMTWEQWQEMVASRSHPRRLMTLAEMAHVAAFMASDEASADVQAHAGQGHGQPSAKVLDAAWVRAGEAEPGLLDGIVSFGKRGQHPAGHGAQMGPVLLKVLRQPYLFIHLSHFPVVSCHNYRPVQLGRCDKQIDLPGTRCESASQG